MRQDKDARNRGARFGLAQRRGQELARLRRENARLRAQLAAVRALFQRTEHTSIGHEDWQALKNALEMA